MSHTLEELTALANEPSRARSRAEAMGFVFDPVRVLFNEDLNAYHVDVRFHCVCGRVERFVMTHTKIFVDEVPEIISDIVRHLERRGSFSREHLKQDGYTEEQIREIERRGLEFDQQQMALS